MLVAVLKCAAFTFAHEKGTEQMNISLLLGCGQLTRTTNWNACKQIVNLEQSSSPGWPAYMEIIPPSRGLINDLTNIASICSFSADYCIWFLSINFSLVGLNCTWLHTPSQILKNIIDVLKSICASPPNLGEWNTAQFWSIQRPKRELHCVSIRFFAQSSKIVPKYELCFKWHRESAAQGENMQLDCTRRTWRQPCRRPITGAACGEGRRKDGGRRSAEQWMTRPTRVEGPRWPSATDVKLGLIIASSAALKRRSGGGSFFFRYF